MLVLAGIGRGRMRVQIFQQRTIAQPNAFEDRNQIAHGQWSWVLNSKETSFKGAAALPLNYREIQARSKLVREIEALIRDLVISEPTFSRDYTRRYAKIQELKRTLDGADYDDLVKDIKRRRQR